MRTSHKVAEVACYRTKRTLVARWGLAHPMRVLELTKDGIVDQVKCTAPFQAALLWTRSEWLH